MPDLKQELQILADRRSAESTADFESVLITARSRSHRRTAALAGVVAVVVGTAAVLSVTPGRLDTAPAPAATVSPDQASGIKITPAEAGPGQTLSLTFAEKNFRGVSFTLSLESEPAYVLYCLGSDRVGGKPWWWGVAGGPLCGGPEVGIVGPGPDHVVVPDTAEDGTYRLCTAANAIEQICGLLTVRR
jgi:hypothetical protein